MHSSGAFSILKIGFCEAAVRATQETDKVILQEGQTMGFLKNLIERSVSEGIGKGIRNAVSNAVEKTVAPAANAAANQAAENINQAAAEINANAKESSEALSNLEQATLNLANAMEAAGYVSENGENGRIPEALLAEDGLEAAFKIRKVLAEAFPQYEVRENVSPTTIGGTGKFMNYSFGVYAGGSPKLFIMLVGKSTCRTRLYRFSKEAAAANGITMINFIEHYPNNPAYILLRLKKYL